MPRKTKTTYKLPKKTEIHNSVPRAISGSPELEETLQAWRESNVVDSETLFVPHWMLKDFIDNGKIPDCKAQHLPKGTGFVSNLNSPRLASSQLLLLRSIGREESEEDRNLYSGAEDPTASTEDEYDELIANLAQKNLSIIPLLDAESQHSHSAQLDAKPVQPVKLVQSIGMVQHTTLGDVEPIWQTLKFSTSTSIARHMSAVENRRLDSVELIVTAVRNFWIDNMQLKIGNSYMHVDRYIFNYYMQAFQDHNSCYLELPSHKVSMNLMLKLYSWIVNDEEQLQLGNQFLDIYAMSKFLNVRYLNEQFWHSLSASGELGFWEAASFQAYLPARRVQCGDLMSIFLSRIRKCFLPLVASFEFVNLDAVELIYLLKMDTLCVNSEDEMFFAALRWLEHDWHHREKLLVKIMSAVRFNMLSPWLQRSICYQPETELIRKVGSNPIIKARLWHACLFGQVAYAYKKCPADLDEDLLRKYNSLKEVERMWIYCEGVPHHHDVKCPHFRPLTWGTFKLFLNNLQSYAEEFFEALKLVPHKHWNTYECCKDFNISGKATVQRKNVRPPFYQTGIMCREP